MRMKCTLISPLSLLATSLLVLVTANSTLAGKPETGSKTVYTTVTLDVRAGQVDSFPSDVQESNSTILCVGSLWQTGDNSAVLWRATPGGSGYTVETCLLATGKEATAVNSHEEVVGNTSSFDAASQLWMALGLYWPTSSATPLALPALSGDNGTRADGLNDAGVIVGSSINKYATYKPDGTVDAVFEEPTAVAWRVVLVGGTPEILGPFALDSHWSGASDINETDAGGVAQVVGITAQGPSGWDVSCQADGQLTVLAGPYSLVPPEYQGWGGATGINNFGDACGKAVGAVAFRTSSDGLFEELSTPRNGYSEASDINDTGQTVGQVRDPRKGTYGVLWAPDGSQLNLNSALGRSSNWRRIWNARSITAGGTISARGALDTDSGNGRALLLIPQ